MGKPNPRRTNGHRRNKLRARVLASEDVCALCGGEVDKTLRLDEVGRPHPLSAEVDEIIPVSRGGDPYLWGNVQLAHRICNQRTGNKIIGELPPPPAHALVLPSSQAW
ncbi:HNH endonuclease [Rhodococcus jostii]|uniref:HNH endonuclease n=1 Tax=Rhodococcus jostii TaxID=132919 RepID=UPI0036253619